MIIQLTKGQQVTIPANIRHELGIKPGSKLTLEEKKGKIIITPLKDETEELFAQAKTYPKHKLTPEELDDFTEFY